MHLRLESRLFRRAAGPTDWPDHRRAGGCLRFGQGNGNLVRRLALRTGTLYHLACALGGARLPSWAPMRPRPPMAHPQLRGQTNEQKRTDRGGGGGVLAPQGTEAEAKAALAQAALNAYPNGLHYVGRHNGAKGLGRRPYRPGISRHPVQIILGPKNHANQTSKRPWRKPMRGRCLLVTPSSCLERHWPRAWFGRFRAWRPSPSAGRRPLTLRSSSRRTAGRN